MVFLGQKSDEASFSRSIGLNEAAGWESRHRLLQQDKRHARPRVENHAQAAKVYLESVGMVDEGVQHRRDHMHVRDPIGLNRLHHAPRRELRQNDGLAAGGDAGERMVPQSPDVEERHRTKRDVSFGEAQHFLDCRATV